MIRSWRAVLIGMLLALGAGTAGAHPHVLIVASVAPHLDGQGRIAAFDVIWAFDPAYSAFTATDLRSKKGEARQAALAKLAGEILDNLKEWDYYADLEADGRRLATGQAVDGAATLDDGTLELRFRLPLRDPLLLGKGKLAVRFYDPTFYIAMEMDEAKVFRLTDDMAARCKARVREPALDKGKPLSESFFSTEPARPGKDKRDSIGFSLAMIGELSCNK
ncbi:MAG: DUF1007 family protein [Magnetospirillum sp. WYHS-4]